LLWLYVPPAQRNSRDLRQVIQPLEDGPLLGLADAERRQQCYTSHEQTDEDNGHV
jgi:hypothetical protein